MINSSLVEGLAHPMHTSCRVKISRPTSVPSFRIGCIPLTDCAPLIIAREKKFFSQHDVDVTISWEIGLAALREKMLTGELDGVAAVAGFAAALRMGVNSPACPVIAPLVLSLQGNAITLSRRLYEAGVRDAATLCQVMRNTNHRKLSIGIVSRWSPHHFLLREWLASGGLRVDEEVRLVTLPPSVMPKLLSQGMIDGFCVGEPWNTASILSGNGWVATTTAELSPQHVEKVLLLREKCARANLSATTRLLQALRAACAWCDDPANRGEVASILHQSGAFAADLPAIGASLVGPFDDGVGKQRPLDQFHFFHRHEATVPSPERALWLMRGLRRHGVVPAAQENQLREALVASWGVLGGVVSDHPAPLRKSKMEKKWVGDSTPSIG